MRSQWGSPGDVTCQITYAEPVATSDVRPWGSWHVLDEGPGFKVKRIEVLPHRRLSLQTHEHLVVIEIQRGPYLGEDDIVRLADDYGRLEA